MDIRKVCVKTIALAAAFCCAAPALADISPTLGPLGSGEMVAGETTLKSVWDGVTIVGYVDWMVLSPGDYTGTAEEALVTALLGNSILGSYLYMYQIESLIDVGEIFSINVGDAGNVLTTGETAFTLFDDVHTLIGEHEAINPNYVTNAQATPAGNNLTWDYSGTLNTNDQSGVNWFTSNLSPTYGAASYADSIPPSPGIGMVATVVPAPGVMALFGLSGLLCVRRRRA